MQCFRDCVPSLNLTTTCTIVPTQNIGFVPLFTVFDARQPFERKACLKNFHMRFVCVFVVFCTCFRTPVFSSILPHFFIDFDSKFRWFGPIFGTRGLSNGRLKSILATFWAYVVHTTVMTQFRRILEPGPPPKRPPEARSDLYSGGTIKRHLGPWNVAKPMGKPRFGHIAFSRAVRRGGLLRGEVSQRSPSPLKAWR